MKKRFISLGAITFVIMFIAMFAFLASHPDQKASARDSSCPNRTVLAFRTQPGAVSIPIGTSKWLGTVDVSCFS